MTNKEIEIIAKSPDIIRKFEELGELHKTRLDSAENNADYKRMIKVISFEVKSKNFRGFDMDIKDVINEDIRLLEKLHNKESMIESYLYLHEFSDSKESGLYQLILNGSELWYGTLEEINAVVKSMVTREINKDVINY